MSSCLKGWFVYGSTTWKHSIVLLSSDSPRMKYSLSLPLPLTPISILIGQNLHYKCHGLFVDLKVFVCINAHRFRVSATITLQQAQTKNPNRWWSPCGAKLWLGKQTQGFRGKVRPLRLVLCRCARLCSWAAPDSWKNKFSTDPWTLNWFIRVAQTAVAQSSLPL